MVVEGHRHQTVTDSDHGPIVDIIAWYTMVVMILAVCLRLLVRNVKNVVGVDDLLCIPAMLCGIGSTVALSCAVKEGLGERQDLLVRTHVSSIEKYIYISTILYLLTLSIAKASTLIMIFRLVRERVMILVVYVLGAVLLAWTTASVFAIAFQCGLPQPWAYASGKCFDPLPFWIPIGAVDILTDIAVIVLPAWAVWGLQMGSDKKMLVIAAFSFRVLNIIAAVVRLVFLARLTNAPDQSLHGTGYYISTQCHTTTSVIVACVLALRPFIDQASSGLLGGASLDKGISQGAFTKDHATYQMGSVSKYGSKFSKPNSKGGNMHSAASGDSQHDIYISKIPPPGIYGANTSQHYAEATNNRPQRVNSGSDKSGASDQMMIRQTTGWTVHYEEDDSLPEGHTRETYLDNGSQSSVRPNAV